LIFFFKDTSSPTTNEFYQSSLNTVKRLLNESLDSNIEIIQMDEQECVLEIVDGVLTIVPKDKSTSSSIGSDGDKKREQKNTKHSKRIHTKQMCINI
jgi:stalled ribosome rescue protein Dom34